MSSSDEESVFVTQGTFCTNSDDNDTDDINDGILDMQNEKNENIPQAQPVYVHDSMFSVMTNLLHLVNK